MQEWNRPPFQNGTRVQSQCGKTSSITYLPQAQSISKSFRYTTIETHVRWVRISQRRKYRRPANEHRRLAARPAERSGRGRPRRLRRSWCVSRLLRRQYPFRRNISPCLRLVWFRFNSNVCAATRRAATAIIHMKRYGVAPHRGAGRKPADLRPVAIDAAAGG
jgi:hypothetical protein